ncbi:phage major capsid protein [bacterium]|nr:MAG: phage major capsid protein [bacterium]
MAVEDRSSSYEDLVSNNNVLLAVMRRKGLWQTYSGPKIRQTLQIGKQLAQWYNGYDQLLNPAIDLFNDAFYDPKQVVVPIILSMQEILNNSGSAQLMDTLDSYMSAAERALEDAMDAGIFSDGTANGNKQLTGLATAVPITPTNIYGGIDRGTATIWATKSFDAQTYNTVIGTQVNATTIRPLLNSIMTQQSRGRDYADLLIMSPQHYAAYDAATVAIQRQTNETSLGKLGFTALEYIGGGKRAEIVLDGGIGSNMPADTTFGLNTDTFRLRYHPDRNFDKLFSGDGQMPIDKDAIAQFIGWMGELTMTSSLFNWRFRDSNPAA